MAGRGTEDPEQFIDRPPSVRYRTHAHYDALRRQSRKLGQGALRTLGEVKHSARQLFSQRLGRTNTGADNIEELKKVVAHSHEVIVGAKTTLPILFPHEIILDRTKVTIIKRNFFWSSDVIAIRIEDILNVSTSTGPLFGAVTIASRVMSTVDHFKVDYFWRDDATRIEKIIEGYLIARQNGIPTDHLSCKELAATLYEIGPDR